MKNALNANSNQELKINEFFTTEIDTKSMALYIRRTLFVISKNALETQESGMYFDWLAKGHFWLNELAERLDPYLEKED